MQLKWNNIRILVLLVIIAVLLLRFGPEISQFLSSVGEIGPGHVRDQRVVGLVATGLVAVVFLALLKIILDRRDR